MAETIIGTRTERLQVRLMHEEDWMVAEEIAEMTGMPLAKVETILRQTEPKPRKRPSVGQRAKTQSKKMRTKRRTVRLKAEADRAARRRAREAAKVYAGQLRKQGVSYRKIALHVGRSHTTVRRWLNGR